MQELEDNSLPVRYIEDKLPDRKRVAELLEHCAAQNHWANHGPVVRLLEAALGQVAGIGQGQTVVACTSGTTALHVLAGIEAMKLGRPLRWAVSTYGFFSSLIGPFAKPTLIDCDARGMLDLDALAATPPDLYDGVCVTNLFGFYPDVQPYLDFCNEHGKPLILDNAMGLLGFDRAGASVPSEIISLHHTKPWGFGEGGCLIVPHEDEAHARALINFGVGYQEQAAPYACNGKLSDVAAAYILDRIEQTAQWSRRNDEQRHRIISLIERAGLPLRLLSPDHPPGGAQVACVAPRPVAADALDNPHLVLRKYYRPPYEPWPPKASELYARIINIPCHGDVSQVPDQAIIDVLQRVIKAA
jgi:dTDP-4-amino-4,6-dideoxygalactose transaminase